MVEPQVWPVLADVPVLRAGFEKFIIGLFGLFEGAFETDIASDIVVEVVEHHQSEQAGNAPATVRERAASPTFS